MNQTLSKEHLSFLAINTEYFIELFRRLVEIGCDDYEIQIDELKFTYFDIKWFVFNQSIDLLNEYLFKKKNKFSASELKNRSSARIKMN